MVSSAPRHGASSRRTRSREMTVAELIRKAAACRRCGKPHDYLRIGPNQRSWASPEDGHEYVPLADPNQLALMHSIATGKYENPWDSQGNRWWRDEVVKGA